MNFMKINLEIKNKILILIYKINIYGSLNNNQKLFNPNNYLLILKFN